MFESLGDDAKRGRNHAVEGVWLGQQAATTAPESLLEKGRGSHSSHRDLIDKKLAASASATTRWGSSPAAIPLRSLPGSRGSFGKPSVVPLIMWHQIQVRCLTQAHRSGSSRPAVQPAPTCVPAAARRM